MDAGLWGVTGGVEREREEDTWKAPGPPLQSSRSQLFPQGAQGNICSEDFSQQRGPLLLAGACGQIPAWSSGGWEPTQMGWGGGRKPPLSLWRGRGPRTRADPGLLQNFLAWPMEGERE